MFSRGLAGDVAACANNHNHNDNNRNHNSNLSRRHRTAYTTFRNLVVNPPSFFPVFPPGPLRYSPSRDPPLSRVSRRPPTLPLPGTSSKSFFGAMTDSRSSALASESRLDSVSRTFWCATLICTSFAHNSPFFSLSALYPVLWLGRAAHSILTPPLTCALFRSIPR